MQETFGHNLVTRGLHTVGHGVTGQDILLPDPSELTGYIGHYTSAGFVDDGTGDAERWDDEAGSGLNFTQTDASRRAIINGDHLDWGLTGVNSQGYVAPAWPETVRTIAIVYQMPNGAEVWPYFHDFVGGAGTATSTTRITTNDGSNTWFTKQNGAATIYRNTVETDAILPTDQRVLLTFTNPAGIPFTRFGNRDAYGRNIVGHTAAVFVYSEVLSAAEIETLLNIAVADYGVVLPSAATLPTDATSPFATVQDLVAGASLYEQGDNSRYNPGSTAKVPGAIMAYDKIFDGADPTTWDTLIAAEAGDDGIGAAGGSFYLQLGQSYPLGDLLRMSLIESNNVAAYMIGRWLGQQSGLGYGATADVLYATIGMVETAGSRPDGKENNVGSQYTTKADALALISYVAAGANYNNPPAGGEAMIDVMAKASHTFPDVNGNSKTATHSTVLVSQYPGLSVKGGAIGSTSCAVGIYENGAGQKIGIVVGGNPSTSDRWDDVEWAINVYGAAGELPAAVSQVAIPTDVWVEGDSYSGYLGSGFDRPENGWDYEATVTGIGGSTMTAAVARVATNQSTYADRVLVFWDGIYEDYTDLATAMANLDDIAANAGTTPWVYIPPIIPDESGVEATGATRAADIREISTAALAAYPDNVLDVWPILEGLASGATDDADVAGGFLPRSIYVDPLHPTEAAVNAVLAALIPAIESKWEMVDQFVPTGDPASILGANLLSFVDPTAGGMLQTVGGAAVAADGDLIQSLPDQAGGAFINADTALRPTYRNAGGLEWIEARSSFLERGLARSGDIYICAALRFPNASFDQHFMDTFYESDPWYLQSHYSFARDQFADPIAGFKLDSNDGAATVVGEAGTDRIYVVEVIATDTERTIVVHTEGFPPAITTTAVTSTMEDTAFLSMFGENSDGAPGSSGDIDLYWRSASNVIPDQAARNNLVHLGAAAAGVVLLPPPVSSFVPDVDNLSTAFAIDARDTPPFTAGTATGYDQSTVAVADTDGDGPAFIFDDTAGIDLDAVLLEGVSWVWKARVKLPTSRQDLFALYSTAGNDRSYIFRSLDNRLLLLSSQDGVNLDSDLNETFAVDTITDLEVRYVASTRTLTASLDGVVTRTQVQDPGFSVHTPANASLKSEIGGLGTDYISGKIFSMSLEYLSD